MDKCLTISESEAKIVLKVRPEDEERSDRVVSEKIPLPGLNAYWQVSIHVVTAEVDTTEVDTTFDMILFRGFWTCELVMNDQEIIKANSYMGHFQRFYEETEENSFLHDDDGLIHGFLPNGSEMVPINRRRVAGITSKEFYDAQPSDIADFNFHFKVSIVSALPSFTSCLSYQISTLPCWISGAKSLLSTGEFSDFTYVVRGVDFKVHKVILSHASPVFRRTFTCGLDESKDGVAEIDDCDPELFQRLLIFIYEGKVPENIHEIAVDLFMLAHIYQIHTLENICSSFILNTELNEKNAVELYELAVTYDLNKLKARCWSFIKIKMLKIYGPCEDGDAFTVDELRDLIAEISRCDARKKELLSRKRKRSASSSSDAAANQSSIW